jgi:hypothetical protein
MNAKASGPLPAPSATTSRAQIDIGTITGTVTDPSGAVVRNAEVTAVHDGKQTTATSNKEGEYVLPSVEPGTYDLTIRAPGFKKHVLKSVLQKAGANTYVKSTLWRYGRRKTDEQIRKVANAKYADVQPRNFWRYLTQTCLYVHVSGGASGASKEVRISPIGLALLSILLALLLFGFGLHNVSVVNLLRAIFSIRLP